MKILVVEDDINSRIFLERALHSQGYAVETANNGVQALEKAVFAPPDMIISDIMMPEMDGFELCRRVKQDKRLSAIPFVFYSATYIENGDKQLAMALGASRFLIKPMELVDFFDAIQGVIENHKWYSLPVPEEPLMELAELDRMQMESLTRKLDKKVRELRKEREELVTVRGEWENIFQAIGNPTLIVDPEHTILAANRAAVNAVSAGTPETLIGQKCYAVFHNSPLPPEGCPCATIISSKKLEENEIEVQTLGGIFFVSCTPVFDDKGVIRKIIHIATDITARKQAEEQLKEREERFREIFENIGSGIAIYEAANNGEDFIFKDINPAGARMRLISREEHIERSVRDVYPGVCDLGLFALLQEVWRTGTPQRHPVFCYQDGRIVLWVENYVCKLPGGEVMAVYEDITEQKRSEEMMASLQAQLRQSQKMEAIGQLAGGVAHDFNNLLTVINVQSQLALRGIKEEDPLQEKIKDIEQAAERAANLTRQLLAFSRRQLLETKIVSVNVIVSDVEKMLKRVIGENIELNVSLAHDLGLVKVDPGQIEQVIVNLAINAKDAMLHGGKLFIETANVELDEEFCRIHSELVSGAYIMLAITDTGSGIAEEIKVKIFDPFFTTKEKGKGTGLGLSTVYGIVKQSGGDIFVYSEPNKGSTFRVYLPRVFKVEEEMPQGKRLEQIPRGSETILVVEDDGRVRKMAVEILKRQGYRVLEADSGEEALAIGEKEKGPIDLILTDIVMPNMDGTQFIERLNQVRKNFIVLYMTGYADNTIIQVIVDQGFDLIQKPFTVEKLAGKIREVLDRKIKS